MQQQTVILEHNQPNEIDFNRLDSIKNVKILLVIPKYNFNKEIYYAYTFPAGLCYVSSILKRAGCEVDCLNLNHLYGTDSELLTEALDNSEYDLVCVGGNDFIYTKVKDMIEVVRNHKTKPKFILAGHILTHEPELMFETLNPDFGIIGEGEVTIVELLDALVNNKNLNDVDGIIYKGLNGKTIRTNRRTPIKDINILPFPDYESFGFGEYLEHIYCNDYYYNSLLNFPKTYPLLGSRGCAFNCTFCWHPENYRWRSVDNIMDELRSVVKKFRINNLLILDDCFSIKQERIYEFCERIKELSKEVGWNIKWACQLLVHTVDQKLLATMKEAGCETISYGFESFSPIVLKSMMKPITPDQIDKAMHSTLNVKIGLQCHFIFGDTAETKETATETLNYWISTGNDQIGLGFIQPYPGSVMYQRCIEKGIIKDKLSYIKTGMDAHNFINMTDNMTDEEISQLRFNMLKAYSKHVKFVRPISIKKDNKGYEVKVKCPYCKERVTYKNCYIKNKYTYGFNIVCRSCAHRFYIVSLLQKTAYKNYDKVRSIRDYYKKIFKLDRLHH